jgi:hypothetical protein
MFNNQLILYIYDSKDIKNDNKRKKYIKKLPILNIFPKSHFYYYL